MADLNEVKKQLYKQKPVAVKTAHKDGKHYHYVCQLVLDNQNCIIEFKVPISDMGTANFDNTMSSQLLIRWIV